MPIARGPQTHCPLWCVCIAQAMGVRIQVWGLGSASAHLGRIADRCSHGKLPQAGPCRNHAQGAAGLCSNNAVLCWLLPLLSDQQQLMQATCHSLTALT